MGATDNFFKAIKNVMLLTNEVKGLTKEVIDLSQEVREIDRRLIRIETMVEISHWYSSGIRKAKFPISIF